MIGTAQNWRRSVASIYQTRPLCRRDTDIQRPCRRLPLVRQLLRLHKKIRIKTRNDTVDLFTVSRRQKKVPPFAYGYDYSRTGQNRL